jgi:hypothetical protein
MEGEIIDFFGADSIFELRDGRLVRAGRVVNDHIGRTRDCSAGKSCRQEISFSWVAKGNALVTPEDLNVRVVYSNDDDNEIW